MFPGVDGPEGSPEGLHQVGESRLFARIRLIGGFIQRFVVHIENEQEKREYPRKNPPDKGIFTAPSGKHNTKDSRHSEQQQQKNEFTHRLSSQERCNSVASIRRLCKPQRGRGLCQFQTKDDLKAARIEAARRTEAYVEQPKTSQRREGLDRELELRSMTEGR